MLKRIINYRATFPGVTVWQMIKLYAIRWLRRGLVQDGVIDTREYMRFSGKDDVREIDCSNSRQIVCISGLGCSGSGAIEDLLSEYDNVTVLADTELASYRDKAASVDFEFDLLRDTYGLFSIEKCLSSQFVKDNDICIHQFISYIASLYYGPIDMFDTFFVRATRNFLDEILAFKLPKPIVADGRLSEFGNRGIKLLWSDDRESPFSDYYFCLKDLKVSEFRAIARKYMQQVLGRIGSKEFLVLDQLVSDGTGDVQKYKDYLGDIKVICVYRDPRDVFHWAVHHRAGWIPYHIHDFVFWYKKVTRGYLNAKHNDLLTIRFEDLVFDYDRTCGLVENFLGLKAKNHVRQKFAFRPEVSRNNVGAYKGKISEAEDFLIRQELCEYCYEK